MTKYKIACLPGDGIGKDVLDASMLILKSMNIDAEYIYGEVGWTCWEKYGNALPEHTVQLLKDTDACLFGAITSKPGVKGYRSPIVQLRRIFDLYINLRPIRAFKGNPLNYRDDVDLVIFRENTEDLYMGIEFRPIPAELGRMAGINIDLEHSAVSFRIFSEKGCRRIVKGAFEYARTHKRKKVTAVHKANVIRATDGLFLEQAELVASEYPEIEYDSANVDGIAMWLIKNPDRYDVLVTTNVFGDIISDEAAQLVGGMGFAPSGNIGENYGVFEPTHGSAPKYAGLYKVNPVASILSSAMMLEFLGFNEEADKIRDGVAKTIEIGKVRTYDMGGNAGTLEIAEEILKNIE